jgi:hypothetical protein
MDILYREPMVMLLAHMFEDPIYSAKAALIRPKNKRCHIILDNGAHELGASIAITNILEIAKNVDANEIILPDVIKNCEATVLASIDGAEAVCDFWYLTNWKPSHLMVVPQGSTPAEWEYCLRTLITKVTQVFQRRHVEPCEIVIGVPKHFEFFNGGRLALLQSMVYRFHMQGHQVHCLGIESNLFDYQIIGDKCTWVRSTDSAKPFRYTIAGWDLSTGHLPPNKYGDQEDYFHLHVPDNALNLMARNEMVYRAVVGGVWSGGYAYSNHSR